MKKHLFCALFAITTAVMIAATSSCDVVRQAQGAYNMVNCKYSCQSMTNLSVAGITPSKLSLTDTPKLLALLAGGASSLPVGFTLNLDVQNPNFTEAILNGLEYVLAIDGVTFTSGSIDRQISVPAGGTGTLPVVLTFDAATLLKGDQSAAVANVIKNLAGIGSGEASGVTLNIRPSFLVADYKVTSPVYIPISFNIGGK